MASILDKLLGLHGPVVYTIVGVLVFAEDAVFIGVVVPGETAAILGGVAASQGHASLTVMCLVVVAAAIIGDTVGYEVGKRYGTRLLNTDVLRRRKERIDAARHVLARRGGPAVFGGRFVAFLRAFMPFLAGISHMHYSRFLFYNAAGGLVWGAGSVVLGYVVGNSYRAVERSFGRITAIIVAVLVIAGLIAWRVYRRRRSSSHQPPSNKQQNNNRQSSNNRRGAGTDHAGNDRPRSRHERRARHMDD